MEEREIKAYWEYTGEEKTQLWQEHQLQPCVYCGGLQDMSVCGSCGHLTDRFQEEEQ